MKTRWFDVRVPRVLPLAVCLLAACRAPLQHRGAVQSSGALLSSVPAQAPDTLPAWTLHDSSYAGNYLKRVLTISFRSTASQADRQGVIAAINGVVIGGFRPPSGEGVYYIRLPGNPTIEALDSIATAWEADARIHVVNLEGRRSRPQMRPPQPVPAQAPDTLPAWTLHDSSYAGHYLRSVLTITFKHTASLSDRQALISSLNGVVIGGVGSQVGEGDYYVLIPGNRTVTAIDSIATTLATDPRIDIVRAAGRGAEKQLRLP